MATDIVQRIDRLLKIEFIRFSIVGGTGFVINFIFLVSLRHLFNLPVFFAQLIGAEVALFYNFILHDRWTYKKHNVHKSIKRLLIQFHISSWPAILGSSIMVSLLERYVHLGNLYALALSSAVALLWNFGWTRYVIWKDVTYN